MNDDPLTLQSSDHPLETFDLRNRAIRIALGAKQKLDFIEGTVPLSRKDTKLYEQWKRCDYVVTSWILNSISKDLVDGFIYTTSSRDMWNEISKRFEKSNESQIYELHRKISLITQENGLDEIGPIEVLPLYSCGGSKAIDDVNNRNRFIQFLMGLNKNFNSIRDQILYLDPLPLINNAYSTALKHESQKEILSKRNYESTEILKYDPKKGPCSHCNMDDHVRDT
ncbi:hypothetical protein MANES_07G076428v8 [Manihot esculenta]|uniref:Uncharacterized protein n=1 Tax=Manihot esculenta TaxID=3983 RepID=A0ACB7HF79_MANES|nr:hypothetical protein MANES_07G076428v8 [Manihot esculenta]